MDLTAIAHDFAQMVSHSGGSGGAIYSSGGGCTTAVWDLDKSSRELPAAPRSSLGLAHRTGHSREGLVCVLGALGRFPRSNAVNGAREVTTDSRRDDHAK